MARTLLFAGVGGFLGAGKTSLIAAAAREMRERGLAVGVVANDQGRDLVDTASYRGQGLRTAEVVGGCFCCLFDELLAATDRLLEEGPLDVVLAEAVGSCTDLVATVYRPLRRLFPERFALAPLSVLVEGERLREMDRALEDVAYVYGRQLAEADLVVLSKIDLLDGAAAAEARRAIDTLAPGAPVLATSALRGDGVKTWVDRILGSRAVADRDVDVDYAAYARGEAALGWLNAAVSFRGAGLRTRDVGDALAAALGAWARERGAFVAHAKLAVGSGTGGASLSLARAGGHWRWSGDPGDSHGERIPVIVNLRIVADPEALSALVRRTVAAVADRYSATAEIGRLESFRPAPPVPRHRMPATPTAP